MKAFGDFCSSKLQRLSWSDTSAFKIAVIVLHYRNLCDTLECLDSLKKQTYPHFEIVVVDNGSSDPQLEEKLNNYPQSIYIRNAKNLGFAEGNNIGMRSALERGADAVLLLNNDTVSSPDLLLTFVNSVGLYPQAAAFGAKIFFYDEPTQIWHAGGDVNLKTLRCFHYGCGETDFEKKWDIPRSIGYACGCALFVKREALINVGLMDPQFFLLWEEIDWCWRMQKKGYECWYIPEAKVWHKISRSFEGGNRGSTWHYYYFKNRLLFLKKNFPLFFRFKFYLSHFLKELIAIFFQAIHPKTLKQTSLLHFSALKGVLDFFLRRHKSID